MVWERHVTSVQTVPPTQGPAWHMNDVGSVGSGMHHMHQQVFITRRGHTTETHTAYTHACKNISLQGHAAAAPQGAGACGHGASGGGGATKGGGAKPGPLCSKAWGAVLCSSWLSVWPAGTAQWHAAQRAQRVSLRIAHKPSCTTRSRAALRCALAAQRPQPSTRTTLSRGGELAPGPRRKENPVPPKKEQHSHTATATRAEAGTTLRRWGRWPAPAAAATR